MQISFENPLSSLEKKPFSVALSGPRIQLVRSCPEFTTKVWDCIQRDRKFGGSIYSWVKSVKDVSLHVTAEPNEDINEIDYLIIRESKVIGSFHIQKISYSDHKAELGYGVEKGEEGKGYVSDSLQLVLGELKRMKFNKVVINCDKENIRSIRLAERNGFSLEGVLIQDCIENGRFRDTMIFGKLLR